RRSSKRPSASSQIRSARGTRTFFRESKEVRSADILFRGVARGFPGREFDQKFHQVFCDEKRIAELCGYCQPNWIWPAQSHSVFHNPLWVCSVMSKVREPGPAK